jgi:hypothetical protein
MGVGLRPRTKVLDEPPDPTVRAPVLDPTDERGVETGQGEAIEARRPKGPGTDRPSLNHRGRVAQGGYPPRAPTDPDVRNSRIWLLRP